MVRALALSAALIAAAPVFAEDGKEAVTTFTLDNGMDVVVVEDRRAPVVQHMVWYRADPQMSRSDRQVWRIFWNTFCSKAPTRWPRVSFRPP